MQEDHLSELKEFMLANYKKSQVFKKLSADQQRVMKHYLDTHKEAICQHIDMDQLFQKGKLSEHGVQALDKAMDLALNNQKHAFVRYFDCLYARAEEYADTYCIPDRPLGTQTQNTVPLTTWMFEYNLRQQFQSSNS